MRGNHFNTNPLENYGYNFVNSNEQHVNNTSGVFSTRANIDVNGGLGVKERDNLNNLNNLNGISNNKGLNEFDNMAYIPYLN